MRILITGGSGTVGQAFIKAYTGSPGKPHVAGDTHTFAILSRNEKLQWEAKRRFPNTQCFLGGVEDRASLIAVYKKFKPTLVIHAAAVKHIDLADKQPAQTCRVNVLGSMNVVEASQLCETPITIGISTDKACSHSVYGASKYLMERCFLEADTPKTKFVCCRFGNVVKSNGSVIPKWLEAVARGEPLQVTDPTMCRMMISQPAAAAVIWRAIEQLRGGESGFILTRKLKQVNILDLAKAISDNVEIVGARDGEYRHEALLMPAEIPYSKQLTNGYVAIYKTVNPDASTRFAEGYDSATSERMSHAEIRELIES